MSFQDDHFLLGIGGEVGCREVGMEGGEGVRSKGRRERRRGMKNKGGACGGGDEISQLHDWPFT